MTMLVDKRVLSSALCLGATALTSPALAAQASPAAPPLMLADTYDNAAVDVSHYWVSEKYDGVRAYWNGRQLLTRTGQLIAAPAWFVAGWPNQPLDGELWIGRGQFETLISVVRDTVPSAQWREVRFMAFDLPAHGGTFTERLAALETLLRTSGTSTIRAVKQWKVADESSLLAQLDELTAQGAEGLMLHRADSRYHATRSDDLLKLKQRHDAEARVIAYLPGKGKYEGMMGALEVEDAQGRRFRIGTGFEDRDRANPPPIGSWVTYRYSGVTANGIPRFASFLRVRDSE